MTGHGEKLSRKQDEAIAALLTCPSLHEAAQQSGVADITLYRWLKLEVFQVAYRAAKRQCVDQALGQIYEATGEAVSTLRSVMTDHKAPASARVSAAKAVVDMVLRSRELEDIEQRLAALEAQSVMP